MTFTNYIPKVLGGATLTGTLTDIYTVPAATTTRIEHIIFSNGSNAGTVTLVLFDSSANASWRLINGFSITPNGTLELANIILETGDKLRALATTATDVDITLFGQEMS